MSQTEKWIVQWLDDVECAVRARAFDSRPEAEVFASVLRDKSYTVIDPVPATVIENCAAAKLKEGEG